MRRATALVGLPAANVHAGMIAEHCDCDDADVPIHASNYDICTTSRLEWWFVNDPSDARLRELGQIEWPNDEAAVHKRAARTPREYRHAWAAVDAQLVDVGESPLGLEEFLAARCAGIRRSYPLETA